MISMDAEILKYISPSSQCPPSGVASRLGGWASFLYSPTCFKESQKSNSKRRCAVCGGSGKVRYPIEDREIEDECPACDGKGWIQNVHGGNW